IRIVIEARNKLTLRRLDQLVSSTTWTNLLLTAKNAKAREGITNRVLTRNLIGVNMHQNFIRRWNTILDHTERRERLLNAVVSCDDSRDHLVNPANPEIM